jgi:hypothetical protein
MAESQKEMRQRQRRERRGKERMEKRKYGRNKKKRAANKAAEMENRARMAQIMATENLSDQTLDTGASMNARQHKKNLLKYNPVVDKSKGMGGAGMYGKKDGSSMYGKKHGASIGGLRDRLAANKAVRQGAKAGASMSGEKYDAKEAYNKNLSPKARLHYLENERHDKTHRHPILKHMRKY